MLILFFASRLSNTSRRSIGEEHMEVVLVVEHQKRLRGPSDPEARWSAVWTVRGGGVDGSRVRRVS
jgi:hypothetical protein